MSVRAPGIIRHFYCPFWHIEGPLPRMDYPLLLGNVQHLNYFFRKMRKPLRANGRHF